MKAQYVYNDYCYVLNNFGVASNPIFLKEEDYLNFKERVEKHLAELCEVLAYNFNNHEYQLVVSLNDREAFERFYLKKHASKVVLKHEIPESTYILSQEMANVQSGYAKHFNHKYNRKGAVFARRFSKTLIESEAELRSWVENVNNEIPFIQYDWKWKFRRRKMEGLGFLKLIRKSSKAIYMNLELETILSRFINIDDYILQGRFKIPLELL